MTKYTTVLANLLRPLSRSDFESTISGYDADRGVCLKTYDFFKGMVYGQLAGCFSVREIENSMKANGNRLYHAGLQPMKRSTFCDAMEKRDSNIFKSAFAFVSDKAQQISGKTKKQFKNPLRLIDSSTIPLCLSKCDWAHFRKSKGAARLHLTFDGDNLIPLEAHLTAGNVHDVNGMEWLCNESEVIYVLDRGYVDYKSLYCIELNDSFFVTRVKSNGSYKRLRSFQHADNDSIISDVEIQLTGPQTKEYYPKPLRKVKYYDKEFHHTYEFITNNFSLSAQEIADIYKARWQIELFFKWLKQNLKIKTFWGTSQNAVFMQIWVALIISVLLWICRTLDGITATAHQILQMVRTTLLTKNTLWGLCTNVPPPTEDTNQLFLEGFYG
ncbi:IS4 family transposase [Spirochaetia bacterium]|nr:IS4 family transposase [Spirochaetia bacterium]